MKQHRWHDYLTINSFWLGLNSVSQTMGPLIIPILIQQFVGENLQGTYYGRIRLWSLMVAIIFQSVFGMLSDQFKSPFGKRKPFIFVGTIGLNIVIPLIGLTRSLSGVNGFWVLFSLILMLMFFANMAHGALQGLIPDLVSHEKYGRFSGIKAFFEVPLPVILISMTIAKMLGEGNFWGGIIVLLVIVDLTSLITLFAPEKQNAKTSTSQLSLNWGEITPLLLMTIAFTLVILSSRQALFLVEMLTASYHMVPKAIIFTLSGTFLMIAAIVIGVNSSIRIGLGRSTPNITNFKYWVINRLAFLVGLTNLVGFFVYFLQAKLHLNGESAILPASIIIRYVGIFIALSVLPSGWLADRFSKKALIAVSSLLAFSGAITVILANGMHLIYVGGVLLGVSAGVFYSANWALGTELVPVEESGKYLGISNLAGAGAGAIGAFIGGPIADYFSLNYPESNGIGYFVLFAIYSLLFLFSGFLIPFIKENR